MNITMLGIMNEQTLQPLAGDIKAASSEIHLTAMGLYDMGAKREVIAADGRGHFDCCIAGFSKPVAAPSAASKGEKQSLSLRARWQKFLTVTGLAAVRAKLAAKVIDAKNKKAFLAIDAQTDVYHVHGLFYDRTHRLLTKYATKPIVVSPWGSDVLRIADPAMSACQQEVLRRSEVITISNIEFQEIVLAKYGRDLADKVMPAFFSPSLGDLPSAPRGVLFPDCLPVGGQQKGAKKLVAVGHNGFRDNQHLGLLESLKDLTVEQKDALYVVLQMTYGCADDYRDEVAAKLEECGLQGTVIRDYMEEEQLNALRLSTDLFIYAAVSDGFSASVSQALAAGAVCVVGSWLPYKERVRAGFKYEEIDAVSDTAAVVQNVLGDWEYHLTCAEENRKRSAEFFDSERLGNLWIDCYQKAKQTK